ncbi:aspartate/glutamate racemase family protein [Bosea sp. PAMC 26642]|uniref:aspartate/glutamate racemase family protein n=1 Tax=Bosea sp. (strain PAMC 26642) TaxID=1792307 RepID=UPI0007704153|nr:aspartate/glutamate racemase family protein [Bosea sp. PAMC 26642]AMJ62493.1 Asp/Glu/hydantoin racemase [Bosea sp. PAMC 26642]
MKILLLNPNTSASLTALLMDAAKQVVSPDTELVPATASRGVPYISTRAEAQLGGAVVLEMLAERAGGYDAAVIAAFGDPGLFAARELFEVPVVGMAEAAMLTACMLGRRFAIVTFATALGPWYQECVEIHGMAQRCVGIRMLDGAFRTISDVQEEKEELLVSLANETAVQTNCDAIILAGAPLSGLAAKVRARISVPVIDQVQAAVKQAETLVALRPLKASTGSFSRPAPKENLGLPGPLAKWIAHAN